MAVETIGMGGEINGYGDAMDAFRSSHEQNSRALINLAAGRKKNAVIPPFDPQHPDNQWPVMVYHAEKGELTVGKNLLGLVGIVRQDAEKTNKAELNAALKAGYRTEPYKKPQVVVLDPAVEKAAILAKQNELQGIIVAQNDVNQKLMARLEALEKK
jgi:hypothetical protein